MPFNYVCHHRCKLWSRTDPNTKATGPPLCATSPDTSRDRRALGRISACATPNDRRLLGVRLDKDHWSGGYVTLALSRFAAPIDRPQLARCRRRFRARARATSGNAVNGQNRPRPCETLSPVHVMPGGEDISIINGTTLRRADLSERTRMGISIRDQESRPECAKGCINRGIGGVDNDARAVPQLIFSKTDFLPGRH